MTTRPSTHLLELAVSMFRKGNFSIFGQTMMSCNGQTLYKVNVILTFN
ncbi:hypothetical protein UF75_1768 [Desulfosporosinus sp. I2]|nr:hypothetical protein UF75_1768 [Desulfosporosinus sp. I2]